MPARSRSPVLFSRGSYLAVVFRRAPLAGLSWSRRREHERVSLASADSARFGLKGEERTDDTPPRDRIFQGARSVVLLFPSNIAARALSLIFCFFFFLFLFFFFFFSPTSVLLRASLVAPKRTSYSFIRPNFYERLPAREFRNCLFSGTPGTSWSRPRRHREIESSGFSLPSRTFVIYCLCVYLPPSSLPWPSLNEPSRFTFVSNVAKHEKRCYYKNFVSRLTSLKLHRSDVLDGSSLASATLIKSRAKDVGSLRKLSMFDLRDARDDIDAI